MNNDDDPDWEALDVEPAKKRSISIRLDEDVLDYFKREGKGYQTRMNNVLRAYMNAKKEKE